MAELEEKKRELQAEEESIIQLEQSKYFVIKKMNRMKMEILFIFLFINLFL